MNEQGAAFFDLDGTLVPEPSLESRFFSTLRTGEAIPYSNYLRWFAEAFRLLPSGLSAVQYANKRYLSGLNADLALEHLDSVTFFEEGIARVAWHARQLQPVALVTGTLEPLAQLAASALECELEARGLAVQVHVLATRLEQQRGHWTGRLTSEALYGAAKARAVAALAQRQSWDLTASHAYGNLRFDRDFLCAVGHGHAVNPGRELAAIANEKDWPIWHWQQQKKFVTHVNGTSEIHSAEGQA